MTTVEVRIMLVLYPLTQLALTLGRIGRGEVVNLFLKDASFEPKDTSKKLQQDGLTRTGLLPVVESKAKKLTQHLPTLRYFARELGGYDGETNWEKYLVDAVADIYNDWRFQYVANLKGGVDDYKSKIAPEYYSIVTYADFAVYQSIDNDRRTGTLPKSLPESLVKFEKAFEARPNIAEYIKAHK
ncbi:hypothetical protein BJX65DRAFT_317726 [Aspergillus insuetus]